MTIADISASSKGTYPIQSVHATLHFLAITVFIVIITNDIPLLISAAIDQSPWQSGILWGCLQLPSTRSNEGELNRISDVLRQLDK